MHPQVGFRCFKFFLDCSLVQHLIKRMVLGFLQERMGSAKLLASLLAADEEIVKEIAPNLVNAQMAIAAVANMDASSELRALCEQLLSCMTPSSDAVLSSSPSSSLPSFPLYGWSLWQVSANELCFLVWDEESFFCQDCELPIISLFHKRLFLGWGIGT